MTSQRSKGSVSEPVSGMDPRRFGGGCFDCGARWTHAEDCPFVAIKQERRTLDALHGPAYLSAGGILAVSIRGKVRKFRVQVLHEVDS